MLGLEYRKVGIHWQQELRSVVVEVVALLGELHLWCDTILAEVDGYRGEAVACNNCEYSLTAQATTHTIEGVLVVAHGEGTHAIARGWALEVAPLLRRLVHRYTPRTWCGHSERVNSSIGGNNNDLVAILCNNLLFLAATRHDKHCGEENFHHLFHIAIIYFLIQRTPIAVTGAQEPVLTVRAPAPLPQ